MDNVTSTPVVTPVTQSQTAPAPAAEASDSGPAISSDFETFLVMLTAQIQNQDPLNPIDSTDYAVQLATFSGVEQQVLTNELLRDMTGGAGGLNALTDLAGWVGMEARVSGDVQLASDGAAIRFDPVAGMQDSHVEIRNADDEIIARLSVNPGDTSAFWDGRNSNGVQMPLGTYAATLTGKSASGAPMSGDVFSYVKVQEARLGGSGPELRLEDSRIVSPGDISALRPGTASP